MAKSPFATQADLVKLSMQTTQMLAEAQMVIGMRMLGMMGMWSVTPSETARMASEKLTAATAAARAGTAAALAGKSPTQIAAAALQPVRRRTAANLKRLGQRGPGKP